jgi:hypothetical protein
MREDELQRQIAELVADHADQATPPPIAAIRRRGRLRRARLASGAVLLIAAVAVGLVAVQGPLDRRTTPTPVVTQPPRPIQPGAGFANYVRSWFDDKLVDMTVVVLASGKAGGALCRGRRNGDRASLPTTLPPRPADPGRADPAGPGCAGTRDRPLPPGSLSCDPVLTHGQEQPPLSQAIGFQRWGDRHGPARSL